MYAKRQSSKNDSLKIKFKSWKVNVPQIIKYIVFQVHKFLGFPSSYFQSAMYGISCSSPKVLDQFSIVFGS